MEWLSGQSGWTSARRQCYDDGLTPWMVRIKTHKLIKLRIILNSPIIKCDTVVTFKRVNIRNETDFSTVNLYDFTINQRSHFPNPAQVRGRMDTNGTGLTPSDPMSNLIRKYDFPVPLRCRKTSDTVFVAFVRPLSEPVRRFSSCSTDFSQQIAQVVLCLFLYVFLFQNCRIITSNPPTSLLPKTNNSRGVCGWQKNWIEKG
jgi:hypothetical protein